MSRDKRRDARSMSLCGTRTMLAARVRTLGLTDRHGIHVCRIPGIDQRELEEVEPFTQEDRAASDRIRRGAEFHRRWRNAVFDRSRPPSR